MSKEKFVRNKPHVNIGTIGHVDHGKTSLTSAITIVLAKKGLATAKAFGEIDNAPEERERGVTINTSHVEYQTQKEALRARGLPRSRGLYQEHGDGCGADGRSGASGVRGGRADAQTREHILLARQVGVPYIVVFLNKCDMVDDKELWTWWKWK